MAGNDDNGDALGDGFGLDKDARRAAERAGVERARVPDPLDPEFPYRVEQFDPGFFRLPANPEEVPRG